MTHLGLPTRWLDFLRLLNAQQVDYLVIGGCALAAHGYRRPIADLDVFVGTNTATAEKLVAVLEAFGQGVAPQARAVLQLPERVIRIGQPPFEVQPYTAEGRFIHVGSPPTEIEIMTAISGVTFDEGFPARVVRDLDGISAPILGLAHLRANKAASIRPKDADDLARMG